MHRFASFNQKLRSPDQINLSAASSAAFYGRGVFTTVAIYAQKPFQWEKHWRRLIENAAKIKLNISDFSETDIKNALFETINQNKVENARARITFFDESASGVWSFETNRKTSVLITTADFAETKNDLHLTISPFRVNSKSPLANVKSCNYLENVLALENAKENNFSEAVRVNERGEIAAACMANIFWIKDGEIFTPALETGCLDGTTRSFIAESAKEIGFEIFIIRTNLQELLKADEVFLTSAGISVASVKKIDEKIFKNETTAKLQKLFSEKTILSFIP
jgi:branched-subunit amino acid aminotransferase/4-amino-4-deoxychorismate lyase